ncbi:Stk1 family PASTA domain-containing Ser/Thr kinase [Oribacterium sp. FC2011]|uniref:Stk1 family PASTA domain-containing Ser/Thr kinase n=1 Tax=Oribacterium sp. FC2011 TaxID=1408311 RepID=UPI0005D1EF1A|nr:Stk1 family PASTA domain-containing Ser/Thr kinase [Oribacterium sp. FC2011]
MMIQEGQLLDDRYEIDSLIGQGGMSYVYRATDKKMGRAVAIKVLKEEYCEDEDFIKKFQNEAQAAAKLNHPNIVAVYDIVDNHEDKLHYIVMELVEGITLKTYIQRKGAMDSREAIALALQVVGGIEQAHKNGIVHRDIKPQNMIVSDDGTVKVADFGIARAATQQTVNTTVMGSVHYISPEQARSGQADERSDIYSFGCTLYEMLTGKVPYDGSTSVAVVFAHMENKIPRVRDLVPEVYPALDIAVFKCMQKRPGKRYQHIGELGEDLRKALKDPSGSFFKGNIPEDLDDTRILSPAELDELKSMQDQSGSKEQPQYSGILGFLYDHNIIKDHIMLSRIITIICGIAILILVLIIGKNAVEFFTRDTTPLETTAATTEETEETTAVSITISALETRIQGIIGLTIDEAEDELSEYGIRILSSGAEYSDTYNEGVIISYPDRDYTAGSTIEVTVSKGPQTIVFYNKNNPYDLSSLNETKFQDIETRLKEREIPYSVTEEYSDTIPAGYVIRTNKPDSSGSEPLEIVVSRGLNANVVNVPDLKEYTETDALTTLSLLELTPGNISYLPDNTTEEGIVTGQSIAAGTPVPKGTTISFTVSAGPNGIASVKSVEPGELETIASGNDGWYSSISTTVSLGSGAEPGSSETMLVSIRLRQDVNGEEHYRTLQEARSYAVGTELQVVFPTIKGEEGITSGVVEVVNASTDTVIASFACAFSPEE